VRYNLDEANIKEAVLSMFKRVGILGHPLRPATAEICEKVTAVMAELGADVWCDPRWEIEATRANMAGSDLIIAIGGDGSMLRAARAAAVFDVPVFGINAGHLGFLTEAGLEDWPQAITQLMGGDHWIESRMMIRAEVWEGSRLLVSGDALNDVVISRGVAARLVYMETYIDGGWATTYSADALIIATPTGSTAYALASGGPILPPELKSILVTPVAPHFSLDRPLVLSEGAAVDVLLPASLNHAEAVIAVDGESIAQLAPGHRVRVQASPLVSRFARLRERGYFYRSLLDRMEPRTLSRRPHALPNLVNGNES
jgi:NAD+ kinase